MAALMGFALVLPRPLHASVVGDPPVLYRQYEVRGSANVVGNTVMSYEHDPRINSLLLDPYWTRSELRGVPLDASVEGAYVFYSARMDQQVDYSFQFHRPDGVVRNLMADRCVSLVQFGETFYYCRRDVTDELVEVEAALGELNGFYNAHGFDAFPGVLGTLSNGCDISDINCQAAYGGWSLVIFWSSPSYPKVRNLNLYDGFLAMYEDHLSGISPPIQLSGFNVGDPAVGEIAFFALEGDPHLGHPPLGPEWADFMYFEAEDGTREKLQDAVNPPDNLFNSTVPDSGVFFNGIDLDRFDIGEGGLGLISPGQTSAWIQPGAGDGNPNYEGEFFILAWVMLAIDAITPEFSAASSKVVDRTVAAEGDTLTYTITVENTGSQIATDVVVSDSPPSGTQYVAGSTTLDGQSLPDVGGDSPLMQGLNIGTLDYRLGTTRYRTITWKVFVEPGMSDGSSICNTANVDAAEGAFTTLETSPCTTVSAPELIEPPLLSVISRDGEPIEPGYGLRYRATIANDGAQSARNVNYRQDLPPYVKELDVLSVPMGSIDTSIESGGANGTGVVEISEITIPGSFAVEILFDVVLFSYDELIAAGVDPASVDGLTISTQGSVSAPWLDSSSPTDDPATPTWPDPTVVVLSWTTDLSSSTKTGEDVNGGLLKPGDVIAYEIAVRNTGQAPATAHLVDDLPEGVEDCSIVDAPEGALCSQDGGANGTGQLLATGFVVEPEETVWVRFSVRVSDDVPDRTIVRNRAELTLDESLASTTLLSEALEVFARPLLHASTKAVSGHQGRIVEPGDQLDYEIVLVNSGNRPATNIRVEDSLDSALALVEVGQGGSVVGDEIVWDAATTPALASIEPGETATLTFTAAVLTPLDDGVVIANQADIYADQVLLKEVTGDADTPDYDDPTLVTVSSSPVLDRTTKGVENLSGTLDEIRPGHRLLYTLTLRNTGTSVARNVEVSDPIDPNLVDVTPLDGGALVGDALRWVVGDVALSPAGDIVLRFEATVASALPNGTEISNQAEVLADGLDEPALSGDPSTPALDDPTVVTITSEAGLRFTKSVQDLDGGATLPGDRLEYRLVLTSTGDAPVRDITVIDPIEDCLTDLQPFDGGIFDGDLITWTAHANYDLSSLDPEHSVELRFRATVAPGTLDGTACANQGLASSHDLPEPVSSGDPTTPPPDDPTIILVESRAVLEESTKAVELLEDRGENGTYSPGDRVRYTLLIQNTGTETASNVLVTDPLPTELENVTVSASGVVSEAEVIWDLGDLPAGTSATLLLDGDLIAPLDDGTVVENQAKIEWLETPSLALTGDPSTPHPNDPTRIVVFSEPVFELTTKAISFPGGEPPRPGDELEYLITVRNTGTSLAREVLVRDALDENLELIEAGEGASFEPATRTLTWSLGALGISPDDDRTLSLRVRLATPLDNGTVVDNQAFVSAAELVEDVPSGDPRTSVLGDPTRVIVVAGCDLTSSTKVVDAEGGVVSPGQLLTWTVTVRNEGDAIARNVIVTDPLDSSLVDISVGQGGQASQGEIVWDADTTPELGGLAPGESVDLTFGSRVARPLDDQTIIENQAFMTADDLSTPVPTSDPTTPDPFDATRVIVESSIVLSSSTKAASIDPAGPGDIIVWTINLVNEGDMVARDVIVSDQLDPNLEFVSAGGAGVYDPETRTVTWAVDSVDLSPDGDVSLELETQVVFPLDDGTIVSNQAHIEEPSQPELIATGDPRTTEVGDPTEVQIESEPDLVLTKLAEVIGGELPTGQVEPGDRVQYTLTIENQGDMVAWNSELSDTIDSVLIDVLVEDGGHWDPATRTALWQGVDIVPGQPVEVRISGTVEPLTAGGTILENQALLRGAGLSIVSSDASAPDSGEPTLLEVVAAPVLSSSTKTVFAEGSGPVRPGSLLTWTIVVENTGNTYATNVVVEDPIDDWLEDVVPGQGGVLQGGSIRWDFSTTPDLARVSPEPGGEVTLSFTSRIREDAPDGTVISNQARIRASELQAAALTYDPATDDPDDATEITVSFPVVVATKTVVNESDGEVAPGDLLRWMIEVRNEGSHEATDVTVRDPLDTDNLIDISPTDGGVLIGDLITWSLGTIPAGGAETVSFASRVRPLLAGGTEIANQAFVSVLELEDETPTFDPDTPATDDPTVVTVVASPDFLGATKTFENLDGSNDRVRPGDRLRYTLVFTNTGNTLATYAEIRDLVDPNLIDVSLDPPGRLEGEIARWTSADIPALAAVEPEQTISLHLEGEVRSPLAHGTMISNQGQLVSSENDAGWPTGDPRTPAVADPTLVEIWSAPSMARSEKHVTNLDGSVDSVRPGDVLEYMLVIINDGTEDATGVTLVDSVPAWTSYEAGSTTLNGQPIPDGPGGVSSLSSGAMIQSARPQTPPGTLLADDGALPDDEAAVVVFRVKVEPDVPGGTVISNQGLVSCDRTARVGTGDPRTPEKGDPTLVFVGETLHLSGSTKTWRLVEDLGAPGVVEPGDSVAYEIAIINRGNVPASEVMLTDALPQGSAYIAGTLTLDGELLSDQEDGDGGSVVDGLVKVVIPRIAAGDRAIIGFEARVLDHAPATLVNQGEIEALRPAGTVVRELTDADPSTPGAQPTVIPIGEAPVRDISTSTKSVEDMDGGRVEPGDLLRYTISVRNTGNVSVHGVTVTDEVPASTSFVRAEVPSHAQVTFQTSPAGAHGRGRVIISSSRALGPGDSMMFALVVAVDGRAPLGTILENFALIEAEDTPSVETNVVRLIVGAAPGSGGFVGRVYRDLEGTGQYNEGDPIFPGFRVIAAPLEQLKDGGDPIPALETTVDEQGRYLLLGLPPVRYELSFASPAGTRFMELKTDEVRADQISVRDGLIDPSGVVYRAGSTEGILGASVWLLYDDSMLGEAPLSCDEDQSPIGPITDPRVGASEDEPLPRPVGVQCLPEGQQGQVTPSGAAEGYYRFDVPASDPPTAYRLSVVPPAPRLAFPSTTAPASPGFAPPGPAVESPTPDPSGPSDYWLRFRIGDAEDEVTNNHVPLDALESLVSIRKVASRSTATIGELVPYTITVTNRSGKDMRVEDDLFVGLSIRDLVPDGMRYVRGSSSAVRVIRTPDGAEEMLCPRLGEETLGCPSQRREPRSLVTDSSRPAVGEILTYGPYDLPAGQSLEVRYTLVVSADARAGEKENQASALLDNFLLARAKAAVRVVPDPLFDLATLYGKVYCDHDSDRNQNPGDRGLIGVRIHADIGHYAVTDGAGKWHLQRVPAGMRLLKLDERTLPPGVTLLDPAARPIYVTPGLDTTLSWRASCDLDEVAPDTVDVVVDRSVSEVPISGNASALGLAVANEPVNLLRSDVRVARSKERPDFRSSTVPSLNMSSSDDLFFHTAVTGEVADWRLVMAQIPTSLADRGEPRQWEEVFSTGGKGRPPRYLHLPEGAAELEKERLYAYWILVLGVDGVAARSPVRTMGVGLGEGAKAPFELVVDERDGDLFGPDDDLAPRLKRALLPLLEEIVDEPRRSIRVDVHVDASVGEQAEAISKTRASALSSWLSGRGLDDDRIEVRSLGSSEPRVPNIGSRNQATNRRLEIFVSPLPTPKVELPSLRFEPRVLIGGIGKVAPDERGFFRVRLEVPQDGRVIVGLRRRDGATLGAAVLVDSKGLLVDLDDHARLILARYARAAAQLDVPLPAGSAPTLTPQDTEPLQDSEEDRPVRTGRRRYAVSVHLPAEPSAARMEISGRTRLLPLLDLEVEANDLFLRLDEEGNLKEEVSFSLRAPTEAARWLLEVEQDGDGPALVASGEGQPPRTLAWDGSGVELTPGTTISYRLRVEDADGNEGRSALRFLSVSVPPHVETHRELLDGSQVSEHGLTLLESLVNRVLAVGEGAVLRVEAHTDPSGGEAAAKERSETVARLVQAALSGLGLPEESVVAEGRGAHEPMLPNINPRNRELNNRVVIKIEPPVPLPKVLESVARVVVGEVEARRQDKERWVARLERFPRLLLVEVVTQDGREATYRIELPEEARRLLLDLDGTGLAGQTELLLDYAATAGAGAGGGIPTRLFRASPSPSGLEEGQALLAQGTRLDEDFVVSSPSSTSVKSVDGDEEDEDGVEDAKKGAGKQTLDDSLIEPPFDEARRAAGRARELDDSLIEPPFDEARRAAGGARDLDDSLIEPPFDEARRAALPAQQPQTSSISARSLHGMEAKTAVDESGQALERRSVDDVDLSRVPAARSVVHLPKAGSTVRSNTLGLSGETAPGNFVTVNGQDVDVDAYGRFFAVVELPRGASIVRVHIKDPKGNEATVSRELVSEPDGLFILGMADTHLGPTGAELAGVSDRTRVALGPAYLHGRGVAYATGSWHRAGGLFSDLGLTLHLDTGKEPEASYFADLVSPERHYPVYGDSGEQVQDVVAMGPLYVSARADSNELRIGSFQTDPGVGGLFRFRRSFYGSRLKIEQPHLDGALRTRGEAFIASDPAGIRPGHAVLQGTGGSLYFMRHRDLVEGSERVRVVVRDRDTGIEIASRPLTRNLDYVVRHREGHLMLMSPLPSVVEAGWMAGMNLSSTLDGNPVFLVIDYEYVTAPGEDGLAAGGYVSETILDWLTFGGGALTQDDGSGADPYRLWGLSFEARPMATAFLRAEMARSRGADVGGFYSADGGLSFASLIPECIGPAGRSPLCRDGGAAYKLEAGATLGELLGRDDQIARMGAHLHYQDRGFYGSQHLLDHGQRRVGTNLAWDATDKDTLLLRLDRVASDVPLGELVDDLEESREVVRSYGGLRYKRSEERFEVAGEWLYARVRDPAMDEGDQLLDTHRLALGGEYHATERLDLVLQQDLVLGGDRRLFELWNDRLSTTLGARWLLTDSLRLSALGNVRWNGENSALVGLQARAGETGSVYARQRVTRQRGGAGWRSQSVVGGEQQILAGVRSYGEYQLEGGMSGSRGRALLGMSNRWEIQEGMTLGLSYERAQVLGDPGLGPVVPGATLDPLSNRVSTSGRVDGLPPFDAVGANPAGTFYPGAISRDAASLALEILAHQVKTSARLELRYDTADEALADSMLGVADRLQTVAIANAAWTWTRDLTAIVRLDYASTVNRTRQDQGLEGQEALWLEATGGLAFRPESYDWVNILAKYTRLEDQRPLDLTIGTGERHSSHVLSFAPVMRTPWKATLTEKLAYKRTRMLWLGEPGELLAPETRAHTLLWINRLDLHVLPHFDLTGEYRVLWVGAEDAAAREQGRPSVFATMDSGLVLELAWRAAKSLRLGVGYSFASFSDDELSRFDRDERGPFLRVTGIY